MLTHFFLLIPDFSKNLLGSLFVCRCLIFKVRLFVSDLICTYGSFDCDRFNSYLIIFSLICPNKPHIFTRPILRAPDYITTSYLACQHFFIMFFLLFFKSCVAPDFIPQYIVLKRKTPAFAGVFSG